MNKTLTIVAAMGRNRAIGVDGGLPWHLPEELQHFKETTLGKPIVMGRRTWESIGRALPGRQNIVVTRQAGYAAPGCRVVGSLVEAIEVANGPEVMVIGGGELYRQALPLASRMVLTVVNRMPAADTWFPEWNPAGWRAVANQRVTPGDGRPGFEITDWRRAEAPGGGDRP